ncbi:hypothetical protein M422DRAFT_272031 [Sphaerobolus stellatus SS14]|uniref:Uncharacterized protein n=1 Tax=Sphaerobolus stellatus (strain SS14) TaxID=990650 RepID=A0A0C9TCC1_SPHS4|nr:hypothetical protein M422DRAFT_272031 [Sphaerobolus stellatus SS14]
MYFNSNIFDPHSVRALLKIILKNSNREKDPMDHRNKNKWLVDWKKDWTKEAISEHVESIKRKGDCVGTEEQMIFLTHVLEYMEILGRALIGHAGKPNGLPLEFPIYGPQFNPLDVDYCQMWPSSDPFSATLGSSSQCFILISH